MKKFSQVSAVVLIAYIALAHTLLLHIKIMGEANLEFSESHLIINLK